MGGDYPLLLDGSAANGGWAASLQVANGNLYVFAKSGGHYWIRFNGASIDIDTVAPVEGTFATKVTVIPNRTKTPDNSPAGTVLATVKVTMSRSGAPFTGRLVSSNPLHTFRDMNVVLARALTRKDDGIHITRITACGLSPLVARHQIGPDGRASSAAAGYRWRDTAYTGNGETPRTGPCPPSIST